MGSNPGDRNLSGESERQDIPASHLGTHEKPEESLESFNAAQVGIALSKLFAASIGEIAILFSRSAAHKHYSFADLEWMVIPPVATGQLYIAEMVDTKRGVRAPVGVVTWALVSEEVNQRLQDQQGGRSLRLQPDEWRSGEIGWLIDAVGSKEAVRGAFQWLATGPFKERTLKIAVRDESARVRVTTLDRLMAEQPGSGDASE